jgi:glycosyltransferase involved in cell wall biosynthesis
MRVVYFTPYYPPSTEAAAIRAGWFVKGLREDGIQVTVLRPWCRVVSNQRGLFLRALGELVLGLEVSVRLLFASADSVVLSPPPFLTILLAGHFARLRGHKIILDVRDLYPEVYVSQRLLAPEGFSHRIFRYLTDVLYARAAAIVSVTPRLVESIRSRAPRGQVHLVPNGYDHSLFRPNLEKFPRFTAVFHGTLGRVQDIELALDVARYATSMGSDMEFVFIGSGSKVELIQSCGLRNVRWAGSVPHEQVPELIGRAHVGLSFRLDDEIGRNALPVKMFEYLGCGIPVALTPSGEAAEFLKQHKGGKAFDNRDAGSIFTYLDELRHHGCSPIQLPESWTRQAQAKVFTEIVKNAP